MNRTQAENQKIQQEVIRLLNLGYERSLIYDKLGINQAWFNNQRRLNLEFKKATNSFTRVNFHDEKAKQREKFIGLLPEVGFEEALKHTGMQRSTLRNARYHYPDFKKATEPYMPNSPQGENAQQRDKVIELLEGGMSIDAALDAINRPGNWLYNQRNYHKDFGAKFDALTKDLVQLYLCQPWPGEAYFFGQAKVTKKRMASYKSASIYTPLVYAVWDQRSHSDERLVINTAKSQEVFLASSTRQAYNFMKKILGPADTVSLNQKFKLKAEILDLRK